ncbi:hypothetical protein EHM76_00380 [bacterium]|nr:MAG: hypothetical protein EHM76_00380 [bacterium]
MNALLLSLLTTKILPLLVPPLIAASRKFLLAKLPAKYIPIALGLGGAAVGAVGSFFGVETPDLSMAAASAWDGTLIGLASVGIHQVWTRATQKKE